ncbi:MAG: response regulator [Deltaproteobacteria bacterium]|nr:response regulator [Deltaproteobacteria bacterium]
MRGRVLLVDDEPLLVATLGRVLSATGFDVDTALSGEAALDLMDRREYDVVVTDLRMEGEDGFVVLHEARSRDPDVCVVVITGHSNEEMGLEALRQGADDYLFKPFQPDELVFRVSRHAETRDLRRKVRRYERLLGICPGCGRFRWTPGPHGGGWVEVQEQPGLPEGGGLCPRCKGA